MNTFNNLDNISKQITDFLLQEHLSFSLGGKIVLSVLFLLYVLYAILIVRQVYLMNTFLETRLAFFIRTLAWFYLFFTLAVMMSILSF